MIAQEAGLLRLINSLFKQRGNLMQRIAVDISGTFTDLVYINDASMQMMVEKVRITPRDIGQATFQSAAPREDYGVVIEAKTLEIDFKATEKLRSEYG
jgi:hypothetical protein